MLTMTLMIRTFPETVGMAGQLQAMGGNGRRPRVRH